MKMVETYSIKFFGLVEIDLMKDDIKIFLLEIKTFKIIMNYKYHGVGDS